MIYKNITQVAQRRAFKLGVMAMASWHIRPTQIKLHTLVECKHHECCLAGLDTPIDFLWLGASILDNELVLAGATVALRTCPA